MSTGAIICISGKTPDVWRATDEADFRKQVDAFDTIRIMPSQVSAYQLRCLWLDLILKGMTEIVIWKADFNKCGRLEFTHQITRLPIVNQS